MAGPSSAREAQAPLTEPVGTISEVETNTQDGVDDLTERVAETLKPLLKDPSEVQKVVTQVVRITEESYSGPTPHPEHLERIERIAPGSARAIINMAASEQRFRHRASLRTVLYPYAGLLCGFALAILLFTYAFFLGMAGHTVAAGSLSGVSVLGVIGWFITSRLDDRPAQSPTASKPK
jgi:uncharacterized membrane protein